MRQQSFATAFGLIHVRGELNPLFAPVQTRRTRASSRILPHPHLCHTYATHSPLTIRATFPPSRSRMGTSRRMMSRTVKSYTDAAADIPAAGGGYKGD
jgi:hypothetical protein